MKKVLKLAQDIVALQSPIGRLVFATIAITAIFFAKYSWLENLSLYKRLGLAWVPSIGLTRAFWYLIHGELVAAWQRNWLIFPVLFVGLSILAVDVYRLASQKRLDKTEAL